MGTVNIGGTDYTIYGDESSANAYFAASISSQNWDSASVTSRRKALVTAYRWLNRLKWQGAKTSSAQDGAHPRTGLTDCDGTAVDSSTVAPGVAEAQYELSDLLLGDGTLVQNASSGSNVRRAKAGEAEVEFFIPTLGFGGATDTIVPRPAFDLIKCYLEGFGPSSSSGNTAYGTDGESDFEDCDDYGTNYGLS